MKKKTTLILFYSGVALICAGILSVVNLLILPTIKASGVEAEAFLNVGKERVETWYPIEKDLAATNQEGEKVKLSDLRGKVWVIAEFFAVCPHCAVRNGAELREVYDKFKEHPDFQVVCISVDPETDDVEKLKSYAEALGADAEDWWFLNAGDEKATHEYLEKILKFQGIRKWTEPEEIEANGKFQHDMGLMLVDRDFNVIGKWPLSDRRPEEFKKSNPDLYKNAKSELFERISSELAKGADGNP
jgi:protein SCO1/2